MYMYIHVSAYESLHIMCVCVLCVRVVPGCVWGVCGWFQKGWGSAWCVVWADSDEYIKDSTVHTFLAIHRMLTAPVQTLSAVNHFVHMMVNIELHVSVPPPRFPWLHMSF